MSLIGIRLCITETVRACQVEFVRKALGFGLAANAFHQTELEPAVAVLCAAWSLALRACREVSRDICLGGGLTRQIGQTVSLFEVAPELGRLDTARAGRSAVRAGWQVEERLALRSEGDAHGIRFAFLFPLHLAFLLG